MNSEKASLTRDKRNLKIEKKITKCELSQRPGGKNRRIADHATGFAGWQCYAPTRGVVVGGSASSYNFHTPCLPGDDRRGAALGG